MANDVEQDIIDCIDDNKSFVLEAGAGSGKTWTLIQIILYVLNKNKTKFKINNQKIACITYTKVARDEITERVSSNTDNQFIIANTIHEFLWDNIKQYNKEIKIELISYINEKKADKLKIIEESKPTTKKYKEAENLLEKYEYILEKLFLFSGKMQYRNIPNWSKGVISHDEVLYIAHNIYKKYKVARKVLQDSYPIIFIDEYQDTSPLVKDILLEYLLPNTNILLGFFGDSMQQIYDTSMGKIDVYRYNLKQINKCENYRSSEAVISVLNKIRDDIEQKPVGKEKHGKCLFYYINDSEKDAEEFITTNILKDLKLSEADTIKRLYLTTASIARKNDYFNFHELYNKEEGRNKDEILKNTENRSCKFANYLFDLEEIVELYEANKVQQLLKKTPFIINNHNDKRELNSKLKELAEKRVTWNIGKVIEYTNITGILPMSMEMSIYYGDDETFTKDSFFNKLIDLRYSEFKNLYYIAKKDSPFSTEHGTKGDEYDNVVCIINDPDWYNYNINNFLDKTDMDRHQNRYLRTKRLFYVVCSRPKYNLAIINLSELTNKAIIEAKRLFGEENFIDLSEKRISDY